MKSGEINELSLADLKERIEEQEGILSKLRINNAIATVENPLSIRTTRRTVARLETELVKSLKAEAK